METTKKYFCKKNIPVILILFGVLLRVAALGKLPGGLNQDEAFAGYEAWSLLNDSVDSFGYTRPVYFVAWGSGMNTLYSYLLVPLFFLFGKRIWVLRLVQAIFSCISLVAFYDLQKELFSKKMATLSLALLVFSPWHIMMSRWGLESNLAPAFLIFGLWAMVKSFKNTKYYILMFLFFGIGLYSYALLWIFVPLLLVVQTIYGKKTGKMHIDRYYFMGLLLFLLTALPLFLFVLVNLDFLPEIRSNFISIPRLYNFRGDEIGGKSIFSNLYALYCVLIYQNDGILSNSAGNFGLYYRWTLPLQLLGLLRTLTLAGRANKEKRFCAEMFFLLYGACAFFLGCIINANVNRINCIHIFMIILLAEGFLFTAEHLPEWVNRALGVAVLVSFVGFISYYCSDYKESFNDAYYDGIEEAVEYAMNMGKDICVNENISYSVIMYCSGVSSENYWDSVSYEPFSSGNLAVTGFMRFRFGYDLTQISYDKVYLIDDDEMELFIKNGFRVEMFGDCGVAYVAPI
ncbi:MAG: ArnT family glycosyltransferase [Lachnospiraceae bacterium]